MKSGKINKSFAIGRYIQAFFVCMGFIGLFHANATKKKLSSKVDK